MKTATFAVRDAAEVAQSDADAYESVWEDPEYRQPDRVVGDFRPNYVARPGAFTQRLSETIEDAVLYSEWERALELLDALPGNTDELREAMESRDWDRSMHLASLR